MRRTLSVFAAIAVLLSLSGCYRWHDRGGYYPGRGGYSDHDRGPAPNYCHGYDHR